MASRTSLFPRQNLIHIYFDMAAYCLIPGFTIYFVKGSNWLTTNFSVLGNGLEKQDAFVFWGLLVGIYFFIILQQISGYLALPPRQTFLIPSALLLLTCAITTPYLPDRFPLKSFLHVIFAFLSAVCLTLFLAILTWGLARRQPGQFCLYAIGLSAGICFAVFLLLAAGIVSSALEIFFTLSASLFCRRLERKLWRLNRFP